MTSTGTQELTQKNFEAKDKQMQAKFDRHKDLRARDFGSNIVTLTSPKNSLQKPLKENIFANTKTAPSAFGKKNLQSFYFKPEATVEKESKQIGSYNRDTKEFNHPYKKGDYGIHDFIFHGNKIF